MRGLGEGASDERQVVCVHVFGEVDLRPNVVAGEPVSSEAGRVVKVPEQGRGPPVVPCPTGPCHTNLGAAPGQR